MTRKRWHYHVAPRYTPGSPALVDERTARIVAREELDGFRATCAGIYGAEALKVAGERGTDGIAERRQEVRKGWNVEDLITGRYFFRPFETTPAKRRAGKTRRTR